MAERIRQPVHSVAGLAVPIETHSNAGAEGTQREERGTGEEGRKGGARRVNPGVCSAGADPTEQAALRPPQKDSLERALATPEEWADYAQSTAPPYTTDEKTCSETGAQPSSIHPREPGDPHTARRARAARPWEPVRQPTTTSAIV